MRTFLAMVLIVGLSGVSGAYGEEVKAGGMTFSFGFESFPGKHYYQQAYVRYQNGFRVDYKINQKEDEMNFSTLSFRVTKMTETGFENVFAGIEVGVSLPVSGFEKSWNLPALTSDFTGEVSAPTC